jgi:putative RecB family exonuclease
MAFPLPSTLTPSKLGRFVSCPLSFRYSYIDHLPEPTNLYQLRGTLVHRALQRLYSESSGDARTKEAAQGALDEAFEDTELAQEILGLALDEKATAAFFSESRRLLDRYFTLEDPTGVNPVGIELDLRAPLGNIELRGIIDRVDRLPDGRFVLVDYKTGRSPRPENSRGRLVGVQFYAYLCEAVFGVRPDEVRLMYLADQVVIVDTPTDQSMRGLRQRATAVWAAIERACATEDFRPHPSPLCKFCAFRANCPAFAEAGCATVAA